MKNYYKITKCTSCKHKLTWSQKMNSYGICPKCGYNSKCTICKTEDIVLQKITFLQKIFNLKFK